MIFYDQFTKVDALEIVIKDINGKKLKTIKRKDFQDEAAYDGFSIANDSRYLTYHILGIPTPYIIEKNINRSWIQTFNLPGFSPYEGKNVSIINSIFQIENHEESNPVHFYNASNEKMDTFSIAGKMNTLFKFQNIPHTRMEKKNYKSEHGTLITPILATFSMEGKSGSYSSWKALGDWIWSLIQETGELNEKSKNEILLLIGEEKNEKEKLKKLYKYLQASMRYVSIQLGIGGWKPMDVQQVHNFKYGDCKALSNYMRYLLKLAGIRSNYVIINAGDQPSFKDTSIVRNAFNHAILVAFPDNDTVFLECTSNLSAPGYQGSFTGNRLCLFIDEHNSGIIKTKTYNHINNLMENNYVINAEKHSVLHHQRLKGIGIEYKKLHFNLSLDNEKFIQHLTENSSDINSQKIISKKYSNESFDPEINLSTMYISHKKTMQTGDRYFIDLNHDKLPVELIFHTSSNDISEVYNGFTATDHYEIEVPVGCFVEKLPKDLQYASHIGDITSTTTSTPDGKIKYHRKVVIKNGKYEVSGQDGMSMMLDTVKKAYNEKIVINCKS